MSPWRSVLEAVFLGAVLSSFAAGVDATESAGGRPVAGTAVNPAAGVVPDQPVLLFNYGLQVVEGTLGASRQIPIAGRVAVEAENSYTAQTFTLLKVWDTGPGAWHFASALSAVYMDTEVSVSTFIPAAPGLDVDDRASGLYDLAVTPIIAGYHFSKDEHMALSLRIWAPTGRYESGQLANLSQNVWTFIPTLAYTRFMAQGWEVSTVATVNLSTRNETTNYQSAPLFTLDALASKKLDNGWALGGVVGWIEQIGDDSGPLADRLNGFRGREVAVGPIATYATKLGALPLSASLRWLETVSQKDRMDRRAIYLSLSMPLPF